MIDRILMDIAGLIFRPSANERQIASRAPERRRPPENRAERRS